ncbi:energy-coupling factor transporter transmembrane component T family protein [Aestuariimicrobium kwangyangense]|uniref:energy-coupling factor transporter transmembrane component T family protein n=1 Tax=Aestuariimicrobium kwangyangense TaxID=396389 RepID=UPI00058F7315|nr:energy-coupling factor transporter transmembrane protein EcfT [Aestuariimicrobium kwangyangense]
MLSLHVPGHSLVHRLPAGAKLLTILVFGTFAFFVDSLVVLGSCVGVVAAAYLVARVPPARAWQLLRGVLAMVALIVLAQGFLGDWTTAAQVGLRVLAVVLLANLVTLTTAQTALVDAVVWAAGPLRRVGVDPDRIGLMIALVFRFIPVIAEEASKVREAHAARGVRPGLFGLGVSYLAPLVIRTLRMADGLGEALEVRGVGTRPAPPDRPAKVPF